MSNPNSRAFKSAQSHYDNLMPPEDDMIDYPEVMDCPECDFQVDLVETTQPADKELTGTCLACGKECQCNYNEL